MSWGEITDIAEHAEQARPERGSGAAEDSSSFEALYVERYRDVYAAMWLVTRNGFEAEEIAQDAFLRVLERWDRIRLLDDPVGYLFTTAVNVWRSRARRAAVALRKATHALPADDSIAAAEQRIDVIRALAMLTARQRAAVVLTDLVGLTSEEAGRALGVRPSTVRVLAARARTAMKERIER
jgi:RNA polymerase sigma-70 factor (ECF subfamily)